MSTTTNTTNKQGSDAPKASENKPDAEKPPTTTTSAEGGEQTKQDVKPTTAENGTTEAKAEDSSGEAAKATETKPDAVSSEESKPEAMDVTSSEETKTNIASEEPKPGNNDAASENKPEPTTGDGSSSEAKPAANEKDGDKPPRLRFNGAARKRFRWLLNHGHSRDDAERLAKEPIKFKELRDKAESSESTEAQLEKKPVNKKRTRTDGPQGPSTDGPPVKVMKQGLTNTGGIRMAVAPKDYPAKSLTKEQGSTIKSAILKQVVQQKDADFKPRFEDCAFINGYLLVHCSDQPTCLWLQKIIPKLKLWKDASVKTISEKKLLKIDMFIGYFTESRQDSNKEILDFVESQNDGISTSKWEVINRKEDTQKQIIELTFTVDATSAKIIHDKGYHLNYKFKKVLVRKKDKPVTGGSANANNRVQGNTNRSQINTNRSQNRTNRVPARRVPSSSFVPIWDSNLPKGGNYIKAPNNPPFDRNRNFGSSNRSNSNPYDVGSRNGSYSGTSYGSSYGGAISQPSNASRSLNLIGSLYDQLKRTVTRSSGSNFGSAGRPRDSFGRRDNGTGGRSNPYNSNSGRSSNNQNRRNAFTPGFF